MDISTGLGLLAGAVVVLTMIFMGGDLRMFLSDHAIIIIFGGSFAATLIRFPLSSMFHGLPLGAKFAFTMRRMTAARTGRRDRRLCRNRAQAGADRAWKRSRSTIRSSPRASASSPTATTPNSSATISNATATTSSPISTRGRRSTARSATARPAFGMIGTLIGMVQMFANMTDPSKLGPFMATALLATLYGALVANIICLPIADKLHLKLLDEEINRTLIIDGILMIREFEEPDAGARNADRLSAGKAPPRGGGPAAGCRRKLNRWRGARKRTARRRPRLVRHLRRSHGPAGELLRHAGRVLQPGQQKLRSSPARCATLSACRPMCAIPASSKSNGLPTRPKLKNAAHIQPDDASGDADARTSTIATAITAPSCKSDQAFALAAASLRQAMQDMPELAEASKHIMFEETREGLNIDIVDQEGRSMFPEGSKEPYERTRRIIEKLAEPLKATPYRIAITGHTSASRSAPRAAITGRGIFRRTAPMRCVRFWRRKGFRAANFYAVSGKADTDPLFPEDPFIAANRRVTITLMREDPPVPPDLKP